MNIDMVYPCFGDHTMTATLPTITTVLILVTFALAASLQTTSSSLTASAFAL